MEEFSVKQLLDLENLPGAETGEEMVVYENSNSLMSSHTQQIET